MYLRYRTSGSRFPPQRRAGYATHVRSFRVRQETIRWLLH